MQECVIFANSKLHLFKDQADQNGTHHHHRHPSWKHVLLEGSGLSGILLLLF